MAKSFELRVLVEEVNDTQQVTEKFKKRELVGKLEGEYPEIYKFEFVQDKVDLLDDILPGTYATISFNLKGKKVEKNGEDLYFTTIQGWKIEA
jgi:hypothetical protein